MQPGRCLAGPVDRPQTVVVPPRLHRRFGLLAVVIACVACVASVAACDACDIRTPRERALAAYVAAIDPGAPVPAWTSSLQRLPPYPRRSVTLTRHTTDIAGFLGVQGCALGERIGERNSGLGRVMVGSQRWVHESAFLRDAEVCLPMMAAAQRAELQIVIDEKRAELPSVVWNAIWAGPEVQHLLALSGHDLDPGASGAAGPAADALATLRRLADDPLHVTSHELEGALGGLRGDTVGGDVLRALEALAHFLGAAAVRLETAASAPDCPRLRAVFERDYVGEIQPHIARTHRAAATLLPVLRDLYDETAARLPAALPALAVYRAQLAPAGVWGDYEAALARHTAAWQVVGERCDFLPVAPPSPPAGP